MRMTTTTAKRVLTTLLMVFTVTLLLAGPTFAAKPLTPETLKGGSVVNDAWAKANFSKVKIYDVRKKAEYVEAHIKGAFSAPYKEKSAKIVDFDASKDKLSLKKFPTDKSTSLLIYCNGLRCWKSYKASVLLIRAGYTNVHWYRDNGFPGWKAGGNPID
jgi:rhodanese-related sulfurtransferase